MRSNTPQRGPPSGSPLDRVGAPQWKMADQDFCPAGRKTCFVRSAKGMVRRGVLVSGWRLFARPSSCTAVRLRLENRRSEAPSFVFVLVSGPPAAKGWPAPQFFAADAIKGPSWTGRVRLANIEEAVAEARGMGAISRRFTRARRVLICDKFRMRRELSFKQIR